MTSNSYTQKNEEIARKWRALIQRRREHLTELYRNGRYKRYFTEQALLNQMRDAAKAAQEWDALIDGGELESAVGPTVVPLRRDRAA